MSYTVLTGLVSKLHTQATHDTGVIKGGNKKANDMYTAFNSRTDTPYGPCNIEAFRGDAYRVFRYYILPVEQDAKK